MAAGKPASTLLRVVIIDILTPLAHGATLFTASTRDETLGRYVAVPQRGQAVGRREIDRGDRKATTAAGSPQPGCGPS